MTVPEVAVIPAAGLGTRFLPVTKTVPKEMLPLVDVPIIDVVVAEAVASGAEEIIVVSAPGKASLDAYFAPNAVLEARLQKADRRRELALARRGESFGRVTIVHQDDARGNGDAVLRARSAVGRRPFLVIWGDDVVLSRDPVGAQLARERERLGGGSIAAVMRVTPERASLYGIVDGEQVGERTWRVRRLIEKPAPGTAPSDLAAVHAYLLEPEIFDVLASLAPGRDGEVWLADAVNALARTRPVYAYLFEGRRFDTGDRAEYVEAVVAAALARPELAEELRSWLRSELGSP